MSLIGDVNVVLTTVVGAVGAAFGAGATWARLKGRQDAISEEVAELRREVDSMSQRVEGVISTHAMLHQSIESSAEATSRMLAQMDAMAEKLDATVSRLAHIGGVLYARDSARDMKLQSLDEIINRLGGGP